ncbi:MAG: response regulator transcription factor [Actinobacteria bacterium]|nr:response regulator transcription factor [Actinomycetota bacterium]
MSSTDARLRVLLADDQVVALRGAVFYLTALQFEVCATIDDPRRLSQAYVDARPDVVVIESTMGPRASAIAEVAALVAVEPAARVLVLTSDLSPLAVEAALDGGCLGVTPKTCSVDALGTAVRTVASGERYLHPRALSALLQRKYSADPARVTRPLSPRELAVLACVAEGLTNPEIGAQLGISTDTVKTHMARVLEKLGAKDRTHAVSRALRLGLFP